MCCLAQEETEGNAITEGVAVRKSYVFIASMSSEASSLSFPAAQYDWTDSDLVFILAQQVIAITGLIQTAQYNWTASDCSI